MAEEITEPIFLTLSEVEALIIAIPEAMSSCHHRLKYFKDKDNAVPELMEMNGYTLEEAEEEVDINIALATSLLETYPEIMAELKEIYPMFSKPKEGPKIIT